MKSNKLNIIEPRMKYGKMKKREKGTFFIVENDPLSRNVHYICAT